MSVYGAPTLSPNELNGGKRPRREVVSFEIHYELNKQKSAREGRPVKDAIEMICIDIPGEMRKKVPLNDMHIARYETEYRAWKAGNEVPAQGYPLFDWPLMDHQTCQDLKTLGFHTVEQLADPTPEGFRKLSALSTWVKEAKKFLEARSVGPAQVAALQTQVEEMKRLTAKLEEQNILLMQRLDAETGTSLVDNNLRTRLKTVQQTLAEPVKEISATPRKRTRGKKRTAAEVAVDEPN